MLRTITDVAPEALGWALVAGVVTLAIFLADRWPAIRRSPAAHDLARWLAFRQVNRTLERRDVLR